MVLGGRAGTPAVAEGSNTTIVRSSSVVIAVADWASPRAGAARPRSPCASWRRCPNPRCVSSGERLLPPLTRVCSTRFLRLATGGGGTMFGWRRRRSMLRSPAGTASSPDCVSPSTIRGTGAAARSPSSVRPESGNRRPGARSVPAACHRGPRGPLRRARRRTAPARRRCSTSCATQPRARGQPAPDLAGVTTEALLERLLELVDGVGSRLAGDRRRRGRPLGGSGHLRGADGARPPGQRASGEPRAHLPRRRAVPRPPRPAAARRARPGRAADDDRPPAPRARPRSRS